ncbi:MAG TPA: DUF4340 domain-containing protein [Bryobacteraceae bacterium]|jgi:hypothetical protein
MKLTRLIIAAVLMAGLGGLVWWSNKQEAAKEGKPAADAPPKIISLTEGDIRQIELDHRDGENTVIKRNDANQWQIVAPKPLTADQGTVGTLTTAASSITAERVVDPNVTDLASYGLAPPVVTVKITTANGKTTTLLVGEDTPTGSTYAKIEGDPRLFDMSKSVRDSLDKSSKDLRDKHLMTFDRNTASKVELNIAKQPPIEFDRVGSDQWQIVKPKTMRADGTQVEDFLSRLKDAEMDATLSDEGEKQYTTAFASAPVVATVTVTDPSGKQTLEVRKSKDDYYAKSSVVEGIHKLTAADLTKFFDKKVDDFRNKKIFDFGFNDPSKVEIKDGAKTVAVEKSGENWTSSGKTMDSVSVQSLIDKLRDMSASKLVDTGFTTPVISMTVVSDQGKRTEKVDIAPAGKDFIARRDGDSTLYQLDAMTVQDLRTAAGDVKAAPPPPPAPKK